MKINSVTIETAFDTVALMTDVRAIEASADNVLEERKEIMARLAEEFGAAALRAHKDGGINCSAFRAGTKDDTKKEEASRLGMKVSKAKQLAAILAGINDVRKNVWQEYQRAYFGRKPVAAATNPVALAPEAVAANEAKEAAKAAKVQVDLARAALIVASANKDEEAAKAAREQMEGAKAIKEIADLEAKAAKEAALHAAESAKAVKSSESLADLIQRAIEKAKAAGKPETAEALQEAMLTL